MIDTQNINPMDWHGTRFLASIPKHFIRIKFHHNQVQNRLEVLSWLEEHTAGRIGIEKVCNPDAAHSWLVHEDYQIGFENPAEATMYTMFFKK